MKIITVESLLAILNKHGFDQFMRDLMHALERDFGRWETFTKIPRPAMYVPGGVLELMPVCDNELYYTFKYVNCHPANPDSGLQTVVATGQLSAVDTGYPLMFSEMTVLTALRTAATAALATNHMARKNARTVAFIGTGAQSEFQVRALQLVRDISEVRYYDIDSKAMDKFEQNLMTRKFKLVRCNYAQEAVEGADIITTCIADRAHVDALKNAWVRSGVHINAIGGDSPGKTELERKILDRARIVVEYFEQTIIEGEIQRLSKSIARKRVVAEFYELVTGMKKARVSEDDITLFDSVGIALEDYSALRLIYELSEKYHIGQKMTMIPEIKDPKNLIGAVI